jgi:hypothetical protein
MENAVNTSQTLSLIKLHAVIFLVFTLIYAVIDFQKHFHTSPANIVYFSTTVHTSVGFGDITPKTHLGKAIVSLHMLLSFVATLLVLERI